MPSTRLRHRVVPSSIPASEARPLVTPTHPSHSPRLPPSNVLRTVMPDSPSPAHNLPLHIHRKARRLRTHRPDTPRACRCWRHAAHPLPPQKAAPAPCTAPPRKACGSQAAAALIRWPSPGEPLLPVIPRSRRAHLGRASEAPTLRRQISSVPVRSPRALPKSPFDGKSAIQPLENLRTFQERQPHGDPLLAHPHWRGLFIFA
jgi:hypothetical protein